MSDTLIHGVGPKPCETMVISEKPGFRKDLRELGHYFNGVDLPDRSDVFVTSLLRQPGGEDYNYTSADYAVSEPYLQAELQEVLPKIIITLGREATRYFLGDVDMESVQGIPFWMPDTCDKYPCPPERVTIFSVIHPAIGAHNSEMSPHVVAGFHQLTEYYEGNVQPRLLFDDPYKEPHYEEITTIGKLDTSLETLNTATFLGIDTEGWPGKPWSLQYSLEPGTGCLIRATRQDLLKRFSTHLRRVQPRLIFHSALHDLGMCRSLGVNIDGLRYDDTMVMAYLLQLVPKGLKASCLRYCSMKMDEYTDIIGDTANILARDYLTWLFDIEQADYEDKQYAELLRLQTTPYTNARGKVLPGRKIRKVPTLPKSPLHKAAGRVLQSKRPHSLWLDQLEDIQVAGYHRLGELPNATLDYVDPVTAVHYGCRDADGTVRLAPEYRQQINSMDLSGVYDLELATYPFIDRMQQVGLLPDLEHFATLSEVLQSEIDRLRQELDAATGLEGFNANSGDQVAAYLFDKLNLEPLKMTESGRGSTNDKILEALEHEHPEYSVISTVREYRETYKLKNTFVDRLSDFVNRFPHDGRIHATFRTTSVVTGRLAASEPNILAMPKHGRFAKDFRRGWVPADGHLMGSWDLSQIELRVAAHLSQDPVMLAIYRGERRNPDGSLIDLHAALAERIFGVVPKLQDDSKHRLPAKAINFGFWMGQTYKGLQVELRKNGMLVDDDDAQKWLDDANNLYRGAKDYKAEKAAEARRHGFIRCLSGRIRYIGGIRSHNERVREEAERFAFSTPIQEGASMIMKTNEATCWTHILQPRWKRGEWIEPLVQIHDDLVLELQKGIEKDVAREMVECMTTSYKGLSVPIKTSSSIGLNWADMKNL